MDKSKPNKVIWVFLPKKEYSRLEETDAGGIEGLTCTFARPKEAGSSEEANSLYLVDAYFEDTEELYSERLTMMQDIANMIQESLPDRGSLYEILVPTVEIVGDLERHIELTEKFGHSLITFTDRKRILMEKDYKELRALKETNK